MDYKKKYKEALERAKKLHKDAITLQLEQDIKDYEYIFPELKESEDERIRKELINYFKHHKIGINIFYGVKGDDILAWLEKQGEKDKLIQELGEYKVKYTQEVLEKHINSMSNKDDERLRKTTIAFLKDFADKGYENAVECIDWLEKQGEKKSKKVSIWKHWKDGIAGNGDGEPIYLIKAGNTYNLSSCLGFECDYIELSELDKLLSEKQDEPKILGIGTEHASGVLKECIDKIAPKSAMEAIKEEKVDNQNCVKVVDKVEPKFKVGDVMRTLREAADNITSGLPVVVSIDEDYYHCTNELIAIKDQDAYEYPSRNRKLKSVDKETVNETTWSEDDEHNLQGIIDEIQANKNNAPDYDIETYDRFLN